MAFTPVSPALRAAAFVFLCGASHSCNVPATLDTLGDSIERSGRDLRSGNAVESELEALYEVPGPWLLVFVPRSGLDVDALTAGGVPPSSIARLQDAAIAWRGSQTLVQLRGSELVTRALANDAVAVERQGAILGHGPAWVQVRLERRGSMRLPEVARVSARPAR